MTRKLSVHIGAQPTGLSDFVDVANPAILYGLNNTPHYPNTQNVLRVQNDTWGRLPDACGTERYFEIQDPVESARHELLAKTIHVPKRGRLNLINYWQLSQANWYSPMNAPVFGEGDDRFAKAEWFNAWWVEALGIANSRGLSLCIGGFDSGTPRVDTLPELYPTFRLIRQLGGLFDLHAYGIENALMDSPSSGAFYYRLIHDALPDDCKCNFILSEASSGNGYDTGLRGAAWVNDMAAFIAQASADSYLKAVCAFQLDQGKESCIDPQALMLYAAKASAIVDDLPEMANYHVMVHAQYDAEWEQYAREYLDQRGGLMVRL